MPVRQSGKGEWGVMCAIMRRECRGSTGLVRNDPAPSYAACREFYGGIPAVRGGHGNACFFRQLPPKPPETGAEVRSERCSPLQAPLPVIGNDMLGHGHKVGLWETGPERRSRKFRDTLFSEPWWP